jgi:(p)ppGpp synthase/HD superfamily hydrolase
MIERMLSIASRAHAGMFDRGGVPYILHPLTVMHYLGTDDEELMCIALGHDLIEDTPVTYAELRDAGISERVIEGIRALTKIPGEAYETYRERVFSSTDAMRVKMADLRHNMDIRRLPTITERDVARLSRYREFYDEIVLRLSNI